MRKLLLNEFLQKAIQIHGNEYDYSQVNYDGIKKKITIVCKVHGCFFQCPGKHLYGQGCPRCGGKFKLTFEDFLKRCQEVHGDKYDYSESVYTNIKQKIVIICKIHGRFLQRPYSHVFNVGCGCPKCGIEIVRNAKILSNDEFIAAAQSLHKNRYDYSNTKYIAAHKPVTIRCPEHGEFTQEANSHMKGHGCKLCGVDLRGQGKLPLASIGKRYQRKVYTFPDGRTEKVQGYESWTLDLLLQSVSPNDIFLKGKERPIIHYTYEGMITPYFPDCFVSSSNTLVETKSPWTWNLDPERNIAKISASLSAGYNVQVVIWAPDKTLVSNKTYSPKEIFAGARVKESL